MSRSGAKLTLVSVLVILLAVLLAALLAYLTPASAETGAGADWTPTVEDGRLPGYEDSPVNNDGRYFYYQLCKEVTFNKPTAPGNVLIENTTGNTCDMQVEYQLEDGTVIYTSPMLEPDQHLLEDKLSVELPEGLTELRSFAFSGCTGLREVTLPGSVERIAPSAFLKCEQVTLRAPAGSYAQTFAEQEGLAFRSL